MLEEGTDLLTGLDIFFGNILSPLHVFPILQVLDLKFELWN